MSDIPWTEKYRPTHFNDIILEEENRILLENIIKNNKFTNLLLHGPPGIGKTTTIINLIKSFQKKYDQDNKSLYIHLNASDERGIDIIRNNLNNFVSSDNLFYQGTKFVILDEVDYMTRTAQLALKSLIQEYNCNIKYCLICNYISKIEQSLQNEFIKIRFNTLSKKDIYNYLEKILICENKKYSKKKIMNIIDNFEFDIRSMINFIQINFDKNYIVLDNTNYQALFDINIKNNLLLFHKMLYSLELKYNVNKYTILKNYISYILNNKYINNSYNHIITFEYIIHNIYNNDNIEYAINFIFYSVLKYNNCN